MKYINEQLVKFKDEEKRHKRFLEEDKYIVIRLDGRAFHTFTKTFIKPYDIIMMYSMDNAAFDVIKFVIPNALFAYVQSDEASIVFKSSSNVDSKLFKNNIDKLLTLSSSQMSVSFYKNIRDNIKHELSSLPLFDARIALEGNFKDLEEYLNWRRLDARKNAISMAAECVVSKNELIGKSTPERLKLLEGTDYEILPNDFLWGRFITKKLGVPATLNQMNMLMKDLKENEEF